MNEGSALGGSEDSRQYADGTLAQTLVSLTVRGRIRQLKVRDLTQRRLSPTGVTSRTQSHITLDGVTAGTTGQPPSKGQAHGIIRLL